MVGYRQAVCDHRLRLVFGILQLESRLVAVVRNVDIGDVDDGELVRFIASEERRTLVQALGDEGLDGGDVRHARQVMVEALHVCGQDLRAVGEVVIVRAVVVHQQNVDAARRLQERPDGVVLQRLATVDECELCLRPDGIRRVWHRGGRVVLVEWVRVDGVFVAGQESVRLVDNLRQVLSDVGGAVGGLWHREAGLVEKV